MAYCTNCGKANTETAKFCTTCGAVLTSVTVQNSMIPVQKKIRILKPWMIIAVVTVLVLGIISYFLFFNNKGHKKALNNNVASGLKGLYPYTSQRLLNADELVNKSQKDLRIMRNEIYARHGFIFKSQEMSSYFSSQLWYTPQYDNVIDMLSAIEKENIAMIKRYETFQEDNGGEYSP